MDLPTLLNSQELHPNRVVVAMSGGVDSSVAAALLVEQGYEVIGMMMRLWSEPSAPNAPIVNRCCTPDQMADARRIAEQLQIPFYVLDVQDHFRQTIVQFFIDEHSRGRTPNPCIECNRQIRFTYLLQQALALQANYLATGHYAQIRQVANEYQLLQGRDTDKDQSYVLHVLQQAHLAHVLFPVGSYTKQEVRELAQRFHLPVAQKSDSQDLCFLGDGDYRRFLQEYSQRPFPPGPILDSTGRQLGEHTGLPFYTIGQRKGLGVTVGEPIFVLAKDSERNALIVGTREEVTQQTITVKNVNWIHTAPASSVSLQVKIRYKARGVPAIIQVTGDGNCTVTFQEPILGITAGQGAVFYDGLQCLGGGIIDQTYNQSDL